MNQLLTPTQELEAKVLEASKRARTMTPTTEEMARSLSTAARIMNERIPSTAQLTADIAKAASAFR